MCRVPWVVPLVAVVALVAVDQLWIEKNIWNLEMILIYSNNIPDADKKVSKLSWKCHGFSKPPMPWLGQSKFGKGLAGLINPKPYEN